MPFIITVMWKEFFGHLHTVNTHRRVVRHYCFKLGLYRQGLLHDLSKYSPDEFLHGVKYYQGFRSPHEREREIIGYSTAWMHHKGRNKHHFEYWYDVNPKSRKYEPVEMPVRYLKEMFCDRVAASKIYQKEKYTDASAWEYYSTRGTRDKLHPKTADLLEEWLKMLAEKGEEETFAYIRKNYKN